LRVWRPRKVIDDDAVDLAAAEASRPGGSDELGRLDDRMYAFLIRQRRTLGN
jgi:hypothetical protein